MSIYQNKYDNSKVGLLKQLLLNNEQNGKPIEYEIKVDDLKVVPRTTDASQFKLLEDAIYPDTKAVTIILYEGQGKSSDKHIFYLKENNVAESAPALSGLDVDKKVNEQLEAYKKLVAYEKLEEQNKELVNKLQEAEEYIEELEGKAEKLQEELIMEGKKKLQVKGVHIGEIASVAAESLIRRNPQWLSRIPGGEQLAGLILEDNEKKAQAQESSPQGESTFKSMDETEPLSEDDQEKLDWLKGLESRLDENELEQFSDLVNLVTSEKRILSPTLMFALKLKEKQANTAKEDALKSNEGRQEKHPSETKQSDKKEETNSEKNITLNAEDLEDVPEIRDAA